MIPSVPVIWESQRSAARITGVPVRTIENWIEAKRITANGINYVNLIEVFQVELERKRSELGRLKDKPENSEDGENPSHRLLKAQCRKTEAEAGLKEFELQKMRGEVIDFSQALEQFQTALLTTRARFLALPSRMAMPLAGIGEPKTIAALLTQAIDECLQELSVEFATGAELHGEPVEGD